ncbi:hypothetical protein V1511DRAFT_511337 [Dipodascopsis uninucleata]
MQRIYMIGDKLATGGIDSEWLIFIKLAIIYYIGANYVHPTARSRVVYVGVAVFEAFNYYLRKTQNLNDPTTIPVGRTGLDTLRGYLIALGTIAIESAISSVESCLDWLSNAMTRTIAKASTFSMDSCEIISAAVSVNILGITPNIKTSKASTYPCFNGPSSGSILLFAVITGLTLLVVLWKSNHVMKLTVRMTQKHPKNSLGTLIGILVSIDTITNRNAVLSPVTPYEKLLFCADFIFIKPLKLLLTCNLSVTHAAPLLSTGLRWFSVGLDESLALAKHIVPKNKQLHASLLLHAIAFVNVSLFLLDLVLPTVRTFLQRSYVYLRKHYSWCPDIGTYHISELDDIIFADAYISFYLGKGLYFLVSQQIKYEYFLPIHPRRCITTAQKDISSVPRNGGLQKRVTSTPARFQEFTPKTISSIISYTIRNPPTNKRTSLKDILEFQQEPNDLDHSDYDGQLSNEKTVLKKVRKSRPSALSNVISPEFSIDGGLGCNKRAVIRKQSHNKKPLVSEVFSSIAAWNPNEENRIEELEPEVVLEQPLNSNYEDDPYVATTIIHQNKKANYFKYSDSQEEPSLRGELFVMPDILDMVDFEDGNYQSSLSYCKSQKQIQSHNNTYAHRRKSLLVEEFIPLLESDIDINGSSAGLPEVSSSFGATCSLAPFVDLDSSLISSDILEKSSKLEYPLSNDQAFYRMWKNNLPSQLIPAEIKELLSKQSQVNFSSNESQLLLDLDEVDEMTDSNSGSSCTSRSNHVSTVGTRSSASSNISKEDECVIEDITLLRNEDERGLIIDEYTDGISLRLENLSYIDPSSLLIDIEMSVTDNKNKEKEMIPAGSIFCNSEENKQNSNSRDHILDHSITKRSFSSNVENISSLMEREMLEDEDSWHFENEREKWRQIMFMRRKHFEHIKQVQNSRSLQLSSMEAEIEERKFHNKFRIVDDLISMVTGAPISGSA